MSAGFIALPALYLRYRPSAYLSAGVICAIGSRPNERGIWVYVRGVAGLDFVLHIRPFADSLIAEWITN